jgi:ribosomal protein S27E
VTAAGIDVPAFVADINDKITARGFVLLDRQVLVTPIDNVEDRDVIFEPESLDEPLELPFRREWDSDQRAYFGLNDPYKMAEENDTFTWSHVTTSVVEPYLRSDELITGLLHGGQDRRYFWCPCHYATVVYTSRHRFVCMSCGATHLVLREPLPIRVARLLTAEEWLEYFDDDGSRRFEEIDFPTIDFRDVENAATIWTTSQWDEAVSEFVFFSRSSPEEIAEGIRGTEADSSILLEAGWTPEVLSPPPAFQLMNGSIDLDLAGNAEHAFREGAAAFIAAYARPDQLVTAVPHLFRSIELLLKARLELLGTSALDDEPNNPTVLDRLRSRGVQIDPDEINTITRLRRLRNDLQHGTARFNHRTGLSICRGAVAFVDRFVEDELGFWIGDAVGGSTWQALLNIPEIAVRAERIVDRRLDPYRADAEASIGPCPRCWHQTLLRPHPATGAACVLCGHVPIFRDD